MTAPQREKPSPFSADILAGHLAEKLAPGEVRQGFSAILVPVKVRGTVRRTLNAGRGRSAAGRRGEMRWVEVAVLKDARNRLYGDPDVYATPLPQETRGTAPKLRWATPEERIAARPAIQRAIVDHICPPERDPVS